ncbi:uncharacterized protein LOC128557031 [Mercenaria mercenaria]|uniref:uncharacterized protein LOC128557031 n=1 Tax=Mercenaria mercenaria TaxID=6596 RepID=UPI00234E518D|nr:uncharacterized protein LOC128557031 [Mercenaria mercenaria]
MMRNSPGRYRVRLFLCVGAGVLILLCLKLRGSSDEIEIPGYEKLDLKKYPDLGITLAEELPADGSVRMEKIIHQTWKTTDIPHHYIEWIKTWIKNHPDWKYMFWTDESARKLIADKYSHLLPAYDMYPENIRRADALRYVVLYEYGGVYVDLDMESLLSLNSIVRKYSCILPQEPYEHPIIDSNFEHLVINAFMACRAGHPLMKKFLETLPKFAHMWNVLDSTGPHYATLVYHDYIDNSKLDPTDNDGVYLAPAEYFFPTIDPSKFSYMKERCYKQFETMSFIRKRACVSLKRRGLQRQPYPYSFTNHHWVHTYFINRISIHGPVSIFDMAPHVEIYG